jgi:hypothetical protein
MASEPELRSGSGGEWVLYLQQSINHHYQQQVIDESGAFDAALEGVVQHFQRQQSLEPTGVVDGDTWLALTGGASAVPEQRQSPDVQYRWPDAPVAAASVDAGEAVVDVELTLVGEVTVSFPADAGEVRVALDGFAAGLTVDDLGSGAPLITAPDAVFVPDAAAPLDASRIEFTGACHFDRSAAGDAVVTGAVGYRLAVTVVPHTPPAEPSTIDTADEWLAHHTRDLTSAGAVLLVAAVEPGLVRLGG